MTKQTEALRMAIEALEMHVPHYIKDRGCEAIQACKEALEPTVAELNDEYLRDTHVEGLNKPRIALEKATKAWYDIDLTGQTNLECARNWFIEGYVQALEFPPKAETQHPTKEEILGKVFDAVYAQYQPKAETQEPMTHVIGLDNDGKEVVVKLQTPLYTTPPKAETQEPFGIWHIGDTEEESDFFLYKDSGDVSCEHCIKLYTTPSREWVGLSVEEIWDIANFLGKNKEWDYPVMFAKTIEKVLREKNDG